MCVQFSIPIYKICVGKQWGIKFVILVEDSETGGPNLITVKIEHLFALQF